MTRALLISNSTQHGSGYLDHCAGEIRDFLGDGIRHVLFVPFVTVIFMAVHFWRIRKDGGISGPL